ncbi:glycerate kinase [Nitrosospira sp. Nsp1]|uniref:glycerate kinase type-2 family protein n=1 Tax=Nitrosospira sp. Nsp1 TaxID=136547 RepID=UPI00087FDEB2|nr:glycerate kinase [Nitrosospira sp. Nsp1]SCX62656.1 hydroxypyruvate reductase [Nitrosospira sp. Nsp1]
MSVHKHARNLLLNSFHAAVSAADPLLVVPRHLPPPLPHRLPRGRTLVVGAGKAAAAMALAVEKHWQKDAALDGIVLTRYDHGLPLDRIQVIEAGHPVPDEQGEKATRNLLAEVKKLGADDFLLCLLSGGGSSLLSLPVAGISLSDLRIVTAELLRCGATIQEINTVRKHLSAVLGGRLAASSRAPVLALIISDVTGDDPTHVASGPCAPDPTTYADALAIIEYHGIQAPDAVMEILLAGIRGELGETPKPGDAAFSRVENRVIATAHESLVAAAEYFRTQGIPAVILGDSVTGESRDVARVFAALIREIRRYGHPWRPPLALISGGETTVTLGKKRNGAYGDHSTHRGRGGRNTEFLLSLAVELAGAENIHALACDTDGIDGTENNAGAIAAPDSLDRASQAGIDASALLARNDSYRFFQQLGDLIVTGPTRTNVNDYRVILIL